MGRVIPSVRAFVREKGSVTSFGMGLSNSVTMTTEDSELTEAVPSQEGAKEVARAQALGSQRGSAPS